MQQQSMHLQYSELEIHWLEDEPLTLYEGCYWWIDEAEHLQQIKWACYEFLTLGASSAVFNSIQTNQHLKNEYP